MKYETLKQFKSLLIEDEGLRLFPYLDTAGKWTIGIGHNLSDLGLSAKAVDFIFAEDVSSLLESDVCKADWFQELSETRKIVVMSMCFNLGVSGFLRFKRTIECLKSGDYDAAAEEMLDSKWARVDVPGRAHRLALMMKTNDLSRR